MNIIVTGYEGEGKVRAKIVDWASSRRVDEGTLTAAPVPAVTLHVYSHIVSSLTLGTMTHIMLYVQSCHRSGCWRSLVGKCIPLVDSTSLHICC